MNLTLEQFKQMLELAFSKIKAREDEYSKLDAIAGDGDHGTAIVSAMTVLVNESKSATDFPTMLEDMGMGVMTQTSGSTSTLLGALFMGMGEGVEGQGVCLDITAIKAMFAAGLAGVQEQTKAKVGDKTMMDALIPAVEAIQNSDSSDVKVILTDAAIAANAGKVATVEMKANFGRARNLGDRSIGYADAGATSWAQLFESFAEGYTN